MDILTILRAPFQYLADTNVLPALNAWSPLGFMILCFVVGIVFAELTWKNRSNGKSPVYFFTVTFISAWAFQVLFLDLAGIAITCVYFRDFSHFSWLISLSKFGIDAIVDIRWLWVFIALSILVYVSFLEPKKLNWKSKMVWSVAIYEFVNGAVLYGLGFNSHRFYPPGSIERLGVYWLTYIPAYVVFAVGFLALWRISVKDGLTMTWNKIVKK